MLYEEQDAVVARQSARLALTEPGEIRPLDISCASAFCDENPTEWFWLYIEGLIAEDPFWSRSGPDWKRVVPWRRGDNQ